MKVALKSIQGALFAIVMIVGSSNIMAQTVSPAEVAQTVLQDITPQLQEKAKRKDWNQDAAVDFIEEKVSPHFNFARMTAIAVGRHWRDATPEQKKALEAEFRQMIVRTYAKTLTTYQDETVTIQPMPQADMQKKNTIVRAQVNRSSGGPIKVDLAVEKSGKTWKIYDVIISGVSMVMNFRETFNTEVRKNGIDGLIKVLTERNQKSMDTSSTENK